MIEFFNKQAEVGDFYSNQTKNLLIAWKSKASSQLKTRTNLPNSIGHPEHLMVSVLPVPARPNGDSPSQSSRAWVMVR